MTNKVMILVCRERPMMRVYTKVLDRELGRDQVH